MRFDRDRHPVSMTRRIDLQQTYDRIAAHFSLTRQSAWPEIQSFLRERTGNVGLDIGVGNARHAEPLAEHVRCVVGLDISRAALREASERAKEGGFQLSAIHGDAASLPVRDNCIDLAVYVATIHHLPTRDLRRESLNELNRVLSSGGMAIVSTWSTTHERFDQEAGFDTTVDWTLPDGEIVGRFYHIYDPEEFDADLRTSDLVVEESFVSAGNCYAIVSTGDGS